MVSGSGFRAAVGFGDPLEIWLTAQVSHYPIRVPFWQNVKTLKPYSCLSSNVTKLKAAFNNDQAYGAVRQCCFYPKP